MTRIISAAVSIPIVFGIVLYGSPWLFFILVAAAVVMACHEYFAMVSKSGIDGFPLVGGALSFLWLLCIFVDVRFLAEWGWVAVVSIFAAWFIKEHNVKVAFDHIAYTLLGVGYVAGLGGYFLLIHQLDDGRHFVIFLFLIIWLGDTAAYYVGKTWGRNFLAPTVSPNKTWEGAGAGLAGSLIAGGIGKILIFDEVSLFHCLIVAAICGIIGQFGDLCESLLKRNSGVKDAGGLIPGHGGVLDRIDSLLFAGPAFYSYYKLFLQPSVQVIGS